MEWGSVFQKIKQAHNFDEMDAFLEREYQNKTIFPPREEIYTAFELTPFESVKVVIIGQDPYHGVHQAHGLAFSVNEGVKLPPSLRNIYKELEQDLNITRHTGSLKDWASQGVLLLNSTLTVEESKAGSHAHIGWQQFTNSIIRAVSDYHNHVVFILWGKHAQNKLEIIDTNKHSIIKSVHPSPLSAHRGFFGSKPFSLTNQYLSEHNQPLIDWSEQIET